MEFEKLSIKQAFIWYIENVEKLLNFDGAFRPQNLFLWNFQVIFSTSDVKAFLAKHFLIIWFSYF